VGEGEGDIRPTRELGERGSLRTEAWRYSVPTHARRATHVHICTPLATERDGGQSYETSGTPADTSQSREARVVPRLLLGHWACVPILGACNADGCGQGCVRQALSAVFLSP
jgi:hypothetical protein